MKRTMEEKITLLNELSDYCLDLYPRSTETRRRFLKSWLEEAEDAPSFTSAEAYDDGLGREEHVKKVWDVHTGAAFSPLYRLL